MKILFLDDETMRHEWADKFYAGHEVHHAYNFDQFRYAILSGRTFDVVSFDHDIADHVNGKRPEITGLTCADWMIDHLRRNVPRILWPSEVIVHSWNPVGAERLVLTLRAAGLNVVRRMAGTEGA